MDAQKLERAATLAWLSVVSVAIGVILLTSPVAEKRIFAFTGIGASVFGFAAGMGAVYYSVNGYLGE